MKIYIKSLLACVLTIVVLNSCMKKKIVSALENNDLVFQNNLNAYGQYVLSDKLTVISDVSSYDYMIGYFTNVNNELFVLTANRRHYSIYVNDNKFYVLQTNIDLLHDKNYMQIRHTVVRQDFLKTYPEIGFSNMIRQIPRKLRMVTGTAMNSQTALICIETNTGNYLYSDRMTYFAIYSNDVLRLIDTRYDGQAVNPLVMDDYDYYYDRKLNTVFFTGTSYPNICYYSNKIYFYDFNNDELHLLHDGDGGDPYRIPGTDYLMFSGKTNGAFRLMILDLRSIE